jgi:hypothetical protein
MEKSRAIALTYYTHGPLQYCQGWLEFGHGRFFIQPKERYRNELFWKNLDKIAIKQ